MEVVQSNQSKSSFAIRSFQESDFSQMEEIEREVFPTMAPHTSFRREFRNRLAHYLVIHKQSSNFDKGTNISYRRANSLAIFTSPVINKLLGIVGKLFARNFPSPSDTEELIVGFIGFWYMVEESHIVSIVVRPRYRRRGFGELLLDGAIEHAMKSNINSMTLEVRVSNSIARNLYSKYNFHEKGVRKRYYTDDREDALIMSNEDLCQTKYRSRFYKMDTNHQSA